MLLQQIQTYFFLPNGIQLRDSIYQQDGKYYYFGSFGEQYKDGYFVLLNVEPKILLFAFPTLDARVKAPLNAQYQFQTELVRLSNLASRQHPNVEDFIDEFLADKD